MIGRRLGRYAIADSLGAGGMGEVYLAHDERLDRDVALKVLPSGMLGDEAARMRFRKEALMLSRLNHPNIATVFDFDSLESADFLVMEYVPGVTLDERLAEGPLSMEEIASLGGQLAEGLAAAHAQNVIHRDLKPGNLRVTPDGRLKILDFGLAKLVRPVSESAPTMSLTGGVSGTVPYMAPEQLREEPLDARTDVHAAGAVLYEMATGKRPYRAEQQAALIDAILNREPELPGRLNAVVSAELETVILKALEKAPEDRYQSARELGEDIQRWSEGAGIAARPRRRRRRWPLPAMVAAAVLVLVVGFNLGGIRDRLLGTKTAEASIAVLPSVNVGDNPEDEYLAEGIMDDLIVRLSGVGEFARVINTTTMLQYKNTDDSLEEIASALGVSVILTSRLRHVGDRIEFKPQLIDPKTGDVLWADQYAYGIEDVQTLYADVTKGIVGSLNLSLTPSERALVEHRRKVDPEAYRALKLGRMAFSTLAIGKSAVRMVENLEHAVAIDSTYVEAWIELVRAYREIGDPYHWQGQLSYREIKAKREEYAWKAYEAGQRVLRLDPEGVYPFIAPRRPDAPYESWEEGKREMEVRLRKYPGNAYFHYLYSWGLSSIGHHEEALKEHQRAIELDPAMPRYLQTLGSHLMGAGHLDRAEEHIDEMLILYPENPDIRYQKMWLGIYQGDYESAAAAVRRALEIQGVDPEPLLPVMEAIAGRRPVDERIHRILRMVERQFGAGIAADMYAAMGENDHVLATLERSTDRFSPEKLVYRPLFEDPRFVEFLERTDARYSELVKQYRETR